MIIKKYSQSIWKDWYEKYVKKRFLTYLIGVLIFGTYSFVLIVLGADLVRTASVGKKHIDYIKDAIAYRENGIKNYVTSFFVQPETLTLDIKFLDFRKLEQKRDEALKKDILMTAADDYVPAVIHYLGQSYKVKVRLKGDWIDHLLGDKWSFRVKVSGDDTLMGMKKFSLQSPLTRHYIHEWIFQKILQKEDVLNLRYSFLKMTLNGKDLGIYAIEEHFEKRLLENQGMKEGPIIKFDESLLWQSRALSRVEDIGEPIFFQSNKFLKNPTLKNNAVSGIALLKAFYQGELKVADVFDLESLSKFFAVTMLSGAQHALSWHNLRFYYNPITSKLMPIGFDGDAATPLDGKSLKNIAIAGHPLLEDADFAEKFVVHLERLSQKKYLDSFFEDNKNELDKHLRVLYKEFPFMAFKKKVFYENQEEIQKFLFPLAPLNSYLQNYNKNSIEVAISNNQALPIKVMGLFHDEKCLSRLTKDNIIVQKIDNKNVNKTLVFNLIKSLSPEELKNLSLTYKLVGHSKIRKMKIKPYPMQTHTFKKADIVRQAPNVAKFPFININEDQKEISFKSGTWIVDKTLILPEGYQVKAYPGLILKLNKDVMIFSKSPLVFKGTKENPIIIQANQTQTQGLAVINAKTESVLDYVYFKNLSNPSFQDWSLTGAITFYESPVKVKNCLFFKNTSEDYLNIVRSTFKITNSVFMNTASDAIDIDFSKGDMNKIEINQAGNDGIDLSGSQVQLHRVTIKGAGDKAISVGEKTQLRLSNCLIQDAEIAIASKDLSEIKGADIQIKDSKLGLVAYQKKPEFGPSTITLNKFSSENVEMLYLLEKKSSMTLNSEAYSSNIKDAKKVLYGVKYGKASN